MYDDMNEAMIGSVEGLGGDSRARADDFDAYVRASERQHKRLAFLLTGDLHAAEDLLQAAYAKMYPHWGKVRTYDVPDAYLRRVMVSLRTSWWRRSRNREWTVSDVPEPTHEPRARTADPAGTVTESQTLLVALRELPERQRAAVVLRHWCDLSEADTAAAMGCSVGTVKSNTSKGLAHLRSALGQTEGRTS
ncbi:RNA polymerase, sigma-24 subunit, ECF subfamily [metagenome]|uniref:RNA polymerase, sigma-24 subunit, ECF subfamily n=1 Tax=metagenome TaxID=256318 RepID=A0A2P2C012_9ZZZZ